MPTSPAASSPAECIRTARNTIAEVMQRLRTPVTQNAEQCTDLLTDVEANLRAAVDMLRNGEYGTNTAFASDIEHLRRELKTLAFALAASERLVSGWIRSTGSKNGYNDQGGSAPLF